MPKLSFVSRTEWGAVEPKYQEKLTPPLELVAFHCAGKSACLDREGCKKAVRNIQKRHVYNYGLPDIQFNFLIGGDGAIYEGRGWDTLASKYPHTHLDGKVLDVAYIGPYKIPSKMPPKIMMEAATNLIRLGRFKKVLLEDCLRSDLDLQIDRGPYYEDIVDKEGSDLDVEDMVTAEDVDNSEVHMKPPPPPTTQEILETQTDDNVRLSDLEDEEEEVDDCDTDDINESEVFNPNDDDVVHEM